MPFAFFRGFSGCPVSPRQFFWVQPTASRLLKIFSLLLLSGTTVVISFTWYFLIFTISFFPCRKERSHVEIQKKSPKKRVPEACFITHGHDFSEGLSRVHLGWISSHPKNSAGLPGSRDDMHFPEPKTMHKTGEEKRQHRQDETETTSSPWTIASLPCWWPGISPIFILQNPSNEIWTLKLFDQEKIIFF